jgi:hypothetical protein
MALMFFGSFERALAGWSESGSRLKRIAEALFQRAIN